MDTPKLAIDRELYPNGNMPAFAKVERRVVAGLIAHLAEHGYRIEAVHDYEEETKVGSAQEALELVFNLDGCNLHFEKDGKGYCVVLICGNGADIVSDYFSKPGSEFDRVMEGFDPYVFE